MDEDDSWKSHASGFSRIRIIIAMCKGVTGVELRGGYVSLYISPWPNSQTSLEYGTAGVCVLFIFQSLI
jgi:hypothetical protein